MRRLAQRTKRTRTSTPVWVVRVVGITGIAVLAAMALIGYLAPKQLPFRAYYDLQATFTRADGLVDHTDVKLNGERVGQVLDTRVVDGRVKARLQLDPKVRRELSTALTLRIRPRGLLGVVYVDIQPGRGGRPLRDGEEIPAKSSQTTTQLDDVLNTLDPATRGRTQALLAELGAGVAGRGDDVNRFALEAPSYVQGLRRAARAVNARAGATGRFVRATGNTLGVVDSVRRELVASLTPARRALDPFDAGGEAWKAALASVPPTLRQGRRNLTNIDPLVVSVDRLAERLDATLPDAPGALRSTAALFRDARPALSRVPTTLKLARSTTSPLVSLSKRLDTQLPLLARGLPPADAIAAEVGPHGCDLRAFLGHWAEHDALGDEGLNYLRALVTLAPQEALSVDSERRTDLYSNPYPDKPCTAGWESHTP